MKITRLIRKKELNYEEDIARQNGHIRQFNEGGCSLEWSVFGYEAEGTEEEIMALVRYYQNHECYGVIPDQFRKENTIEVNHRTGMIYYH